MSPFDTNFSNIAPAEELDGTHRWYAFNLFGNTTWWGGASDVGGNLITNRYNENFTYATIDIQDGHSGNVLIVGTANCTANTYGVGVLARSSIRGDGSSKSFALAGGSGYIAYASPIDGKCYLSKYVSGTKTDLGNITPSGGVPGSIIISLQCIDEVIQGKFQRTSDNKFLVSDGTWSGIEGWAFDTNDTDVTGQGYFGVYGGTNTAATNDTHFTHFTAFNAPVVAPTISWVTTRDTLTGTPTDAPVTLIGDETEITLHGTTATPASVSIVGGNIVIPLTGFVLQASTVTIDVAPDFIEDLLDNPNASVTGGVVTNDAVDPPATPTSFAMTASGRTVHFSLTQSGTTPTGWTVQLDGSDLQDFSSFLQYDVPLGSNFTIPALMAGVMYIGRVRAYFVNDTTAHSGWSNTATTMTSATTRQEVIGNGLF